MSRGTHPVDKQRVARNRGSGVEDYPPGIQGLVGDPPPLQLSEEWLEPLRVFVKDADPLHRFSKIKSRRPGAPGSGSRSLATWF
jgi:hypothetical protein